MEGTTDGRTHLSSNLLLGRWLRWGGNQLIS